MVIQYKCPNCGADMMFQAESGTLHCDSCGRDEHISTYTPPKQATAAHDKEDEAAYQAQRQNQATFQNENIVQYVCKNCGAEVITDANTAATTCSFCGAAVVLGDRLSGKLAPTKIIPFKISKQQAQEAFKKWCKKGLLTPAGFMTADRIKEITGIYVPFWLFDLNAVGEANATCTKIRHYSRGDYDYTETSYYNVYRKVDLNYASIPADASSKMNDEAMDKLEPFHYIDLNHFQMPYLAGYIAEKYDQTDQDLFPRIKQRVDQFVNSYIHSSIHGYSSVSIHNRNIRVKASKPADYTLLPVWMVCYDYQDTEHIFMMNGQTGKVIGKPPISKGKIAAWFLGISAVSYGILQGLALLLGGV